MTEEFELGVPLECAPAEHLYLSIPAYTGEASIHTLQAVAGGVARCLQAGLNITTNFVAGCCYLDHVRNLAVNDFLKSPATDMLFVDADVGFNPDNVVQIAQLTVPVVAGLYPKKNDKVVEWPVKFAGDKLILDDRGLIECIGAPTGFLRINRKVFEIMKPYCQEYHDKQEGDLTAYFKTSIADGIYWGEDFNFCKMWTGLGGKVFVVPDWTFQHVGQKVWKENFMVWLRGNAKDSKVISETETSSAA